MPESHATCDKRLGELEAWRALVVDPAIRDHGEKIQAFERIEMQITGAVRFVKIIASGAGLVLVVCEILRALHRI